MKLLQKLIILTLSIFFFIGCSTKELSPHQNEAKNLSLDVGLYYYVPRLEQFKQTIQKQWNTKYPHVKLNFQDWWRGGYDNEPTSLDVFVFDAAYLDDYINKGYLLALKQKEIHDFDDLLSYAKEGVKKEGEDKYFGIPQIGCGTLLFYRKNDSELKKAKTLSSITNTLGQCTYQSVIPPKGLGLMMDFSSKTTNGDYYLEATQDIYGKYTTNPPKAPTTKLLNPWSINNISLLRQNTSLKHATNADINRAEKFSQGYGRAYVGYSESMSSLNQKTRDEIEFKYLPFSDNNDVHLFYSDIAGINPKVMNKNMEFYAIELLNMLTSTKTFVEATSGTKQHPIAQYLLPVRHQTFKELSKEYPLYNKLYDLIQDNNPKLFRIGVGANQWLEDNKESISSQIFEYNQCIK